MNTDRYKKINSSRLARQTSVDGLGVPHVNRQSTYSSRGAAVSSVQPKKPSVSVQARQTKGRAYQPVRPLLQPPSASLTSLDAVMGLQLTQESVHFMLPAYEIPVRPKLVAGKRKKVRRTVTRIVTGMLALIFVTSGVFTWRGYAAAGRVLSGTTTVAALSSDKVAPTLLKGEGDGRVNILLLGMGGPGHDGGDLTDTIIMASVDPVNHSVALLSIPRDLWVKMPAGYFGSSQKINAAYSAGKYEFLGKADQANTDPVAVQAGLANVDVVVEQVLGTSVDYHVLVNFAAFEQAINTVNGVTVDVKEPLVDATMAWQNNNNATLVPSGVQQMDGKKALMYARSRYSTSDFDRSERQRQLIVALKQKVLSIGTFTNPAKLDGLTEAFGQNVYSDLSAKGALRLYDIMKNVDDSKVQSIDLVTAPHSFVTTDRVGTSSVVRPKLGFDAYSDIQAYVRSQLRDGYLLRENAPVVVAASTEGLASTTQTMLKDYGYNIVATTIDATPAESTRVVDLSGGAAPYTRNYLEKRYNTAAQNKLPADMVVPKGTQFVILVGK